MRLDAFTFVVVSGLVVASHAGLFYFS